MRRLSDQTILKHQRISGMIAERIQRTSVQLDRFESFIRSRSNPLNHQGDAHKDREQESTSSAAFENIQPGMTIGDCRLIRQLGSGGFSVVYLAEHAATRLLAVKISNRHSPESKMMANLSHPCIAKIHYCATDVETGYQVLHMQYCDGPSVRELIHPEANGQGATWWEHQSSDAPWWTTVARWGASLADAMQHAHQRGVIHRDIKPENILLDRGTVPTLIDFNVGHDSRIQGLDADLFFGGSHQYMSPEQKAVFRGNLSPSQVTAATDVYSLCKTLLELIDCQSQDNQNRPGDVASRSRSNSMMWTQLPLHGTESCHEVAPSTPPIIQAVATNKEANLQIPGRLREVLLMGLNEDPRQRPTMQELSDRLNLFRSADIWRLLYSRHELADTQKPKHKALTLTTSILIGVIPTIMISVLFLTHARVYWEQLPQWGKPFVYFQEKLYAIGLPLLGALVVRTLNRPMLNQTADRNHRSAVAQTLHRFIRGIYCCCAVTFACWLLVAISFPLMNNLWGNGSLQLQHIAHFATVAMVHGLVSTPWTLFVTLWLSIRFIVPELMRMNDQCIVNEDDGDPDSTRETALESNRDAARSLAQLRNVLRVSQNLLPIVSSIAMMALLISRISDLDQKDGVFLIAAFAALTTNLVAMMFMSPWVDRQLNALEKIFETDKESVLLRAE